MDMEEEYKTYWETFREQLPWYRGVCDTPGCKAQTPFVQMFSEQDDLQCRRCGRVFSSIQFPGQEGDAAAE
eukprot:g40639.t1